MPSEKFSQSFFSTIKFCRILKITGPAGVAPVVQANGYYRLNEQAGVSVDVALFCEQADVGDRLVREGAASGAAAAYEQAAAFYRGDLCASADITALLEREHLRARFLGNLVVAGRLPLWPRSISCRPPVDPSAADQRCVCREDAHRLAMRCYVRVGQRAQALRQYQLCSRILQSEFDAEPEPATTALYHQVRLEPGAI